jgi:hypothetical protein
MYFIHHQYSYHVSYPKTHKYIANFYVWNEHPKLTLLLCPVNKQNVVLWIIFLLSPFILNMNMAYLECSGHLYIEPAPKGAREHRRWRPHRPPVLPHFLVVHHVHSISYLHTSTATVEQKLSPRLDNQWSYSHQWALTHHLHPASSAAVATGPRWTADDPRV